MGQKTIQLARLSQCHGMCELSKVPLKQTLGDGFHIHQALFDSPKCQPLSVGVFLHPAPTCALSCSAPVSSCPPPPPLPYYFLLSESLFLFSSFPLPSLPLFPPSFPPSLFLFYTFFFSLFSFLSHYSLPVSLSRRHWNLEAPKRS